MNEQLDRWILSKDGRYSVITHKNCNLDRDIHVIDNELGMTVFKKYIATSMYEYRFLFLIDNNFFYQDVDYSYNKINLITKEIKLLYKSKHGEVFRNILFNRNLTKISMSSYNKIVVIIFNRTVPYYQSFVINGNPIETSWIDNDRISVDIEKYPYACNSDRSHVVITTQN